MSLLDILLGRRPKLPPGASYFVDGTPDARGAYTWFVYMALDGQEHDMRCKRASPPFTVSSEADRYRDWLEGGPAYRYPEGKV